MSMMWSKAGSSVLSFHVGVINVSKCWSIWNLTTKKKNNNKIINQRWNKVYTFFFASKRNLSFLYDWTRIGGWKKKTKRLKEREKNVDCIHRENMWLLLSIWIRFWFAFIQFHIFTKLYTLCDFIVVHFFFSFRELKSSYSFWMELSFLYFFHLFSCQRCVCMGMWFEFYLFVVCWLAVLIYSHFSTRKNSTTTILKWHFCCCWQKCRFSAGGYVFYLNRAALRLSAVFFSLRIIAT